jgi:hypothetical protein
LLLEILTEQAFGTMIRSHWANWDWHAPTFMVIWFR